MIGKILLGTAAGDDSGASLTMAAELATSNDAELVILQLEPVVDARRLFDPGGMEEGPGALDRLRRDYPGLRLRTSTVRGAALAAVCDAAALEQPDLIVIGQGRKSGGNALSPRACKALVHRSTCTVLLVAA